MALTTGMLERFKALASDQDNLLLRINLEDGNLVYGYLREVASDFFVVEEVTASRTDKNASNRTRNNPDYEYKTRKIAKTTLALGSVKAWSEISSDTLPEV